MIRCCLIALLVASVASFKMPVGAPKNEDPTFDFIGVAEILLNQRDDLCYKLKIGKPRLYSKNLVNGVIYKWPALLEKADPASPELEKLCLGQGYHKFSLYKPFRGKLNLKVSEVNLF